ncbi:hypothetical protein K504DRAFT_435524 [Pleomassaria siparia CBS 279.74]|uniref:CENP-V/GFA domain-containing protein n=1 Tax=Pleomassaria siparia CBS 279.74 TaxID=1314801 RepID=A0A6G1K5K6_9PLEO|nr:hypothetical protein K504DRAFT_435524 [Pleomassaria siparia CBS 279.74]
MSAAPEVQASETYTASCQCNKFRYTVKLSPPLTDPTCQVVECNCSICTRNGYLLVYVPDDSITWDKDSASSDDFSKYSFATHKVQHWFCPTCGTSCFAKSVDPSFFAGMTIVNVRPFHHVHLKGLTLKPMDGRSYNAET